MNLKRMAGLAGGQHGQSMVEYLVMCIALVFALFTRVPGTQETAAQMLADRLRDMYSALSFFLSLP